MNSRERILTTLSHREPDRVPLDFGSTPVTGMHVSCVAALREYYSLERRPVKVHEPYQMLGLLEEDLLNAMGADVVGIAPYKTMFGFATDTLEGMELPRPRRAGERGSSESPRSPTERF